MLERQSDEAPNPLSKDILNPKNLQAFPPPLVTGSLVNSTESPEVLLAVDVLPSHNIVAVGWYVNKGGTGT